MYGISPEPFRPENNFEVEFEGPVCNDRFGRNFKKCLERDFRIPLREGRSRNCEQQDSMKEPWGTAIREGYFHLNLVKLTLVCLINPHEHGLNHLFTL